MGVYINMEMRDSGTGRFLNGHNRYEQLKTVEGAEWKPLPPVADDEMWKDICGFEGRYRISNYGRVRNRDGLIKTQRKRNGYHSVGLRDGNGKKHYSLHRLVAEAFRMVQTPLHNRRGRGGRNMSAAMLWPYGKCVECANKSDCVDSQAQIIACMSNGYPDFKPRTNADKLRSMSDEELAKLLNEAVCPINQCPHYYEDRSCTKAECQKCWLDWLRQEVET